jgi:polysaccharide export outer membrane protein
MRVTEGGCRTGRLRGVVCALGILLLAGSASIGAEEPTRALDLTARRGEGDQVRISLKFRGAVPAFRCRLVPEGSGQKLVLEVSGVSSALKPEYGFPDTSLQGARVIRLKDPTGEGIRVEIPVTGMALAGWETGRESLDVLLNGGGVGDGSVETAPEPYRIGTGDRLELSVFGHPDLSDTVQVLGDGSAVFPLAGPLPAAGKTLLEVRGDLEKRLREFLVDPQVSLDLREYLSQPVTVVGEVEKPGTYYLKGATNLIDLLAQAGWLKPEAGSGITIARRHNSPSGERGSRLISVRKEQMLAGNPEHNPRVEAGDVITVEPKPYFYIRGEVGKPGQYKLDDRTTLMKAISMAEGLTPYARKKGIEVHRKVNGVTTKTEVDLKAIEERKAEDLVLLPDDLIIVPRRLF